MDWDLFYKIALASSPGIGCKTARTLVSYCSGVEAVFNTPRKQLLNIPGIGDSVIDIIINRLGFDQAEKQYEYIKSTGDRALFYLDKDYPYRLKQFDDAPVMLFTRGDMDLNANRIFGIVGTRKPSHYGKIVTEKIVEGLKKYNISIVSGLAYGIDITAHRKCVAEKIPTFGVLGSSLDDIYPKMHSQTAELMMKSGGLISEYMVGTIPDFRHFPMRNRIIAGLADGLLVVESAEQGGSMITADLANQYYKEVFAIPGRIEDTFSKGCNLLIKTNRAALIESAEEIAEAMSWQEIENQAFQQSLFFEFNEEEKEIVELLSRDMETSIDIILKSVQMSPSKVASILLNLEFRGAVKTLPGKRYLIS